MQKPRPIFIALGIATLTIASVVFGREAVKMTSKKLEWFFAFNCKRRPLGSSHNDYLQAIPLVTALSTNPPCDGVEADVFLSNGALCVAHTAPEIDPAKTLSSLYLTPMAGGLKPNRQILIDWKDADPNPAFNLFLTELVTFPTLNGGALMFIMTGNRPSMATPRPSFVVFDGRYVKADLDTDSAVMPLISIDWTSLFTWNGVGSMPAQEKGLLREVVNNIHRVNKTVRFFATPDQVALWEELRAACVDWVQADNITALANWRATII